jgi:DNA-directed RNA polymerase specialized sigma24 family protein
MSTAEPVSTAVSGAWLAALRERFVSLARRRVAPDVVEDVVQEALRIVLERGVSGAGGLAPDGVPALAFSFKVLRNVIGNHYQKEDVRRRRWEPEERAAQAADPAPAPLEALASADAMRLVERCLAQMADGDASCARYLRRLADGATPRELAGEERLAEAVLYRRVYRCRLKLRVLLEQQGFFA